LGREFYELNNCHVSSVVNLKPLLYSNLLVSDEHVTEEAVNKMFFLSGATVVDWEKAKAILSFVMEKKEIGATMKEIRVSKVTRLLSLCVSQHSFVHAVGICNSCLLFGIRVALVFILILIFKRVYKT
jgi:hypothetical protein